MTPLERPLDQHLDQPLDQHLERPLDQPGTLASRCAWTLVWLGVTTAGVDLWTSWTVGWWAAVFSPALVALGLCGTAFLWTNLFRTDRMVEWTGMAAALVAVGASQGTFIHARRYYTTDAAAFNQVAARLLLQGRNPYQSSLAAADSLLHPVSQYWTYEVNGSHVQTISYPAGSFLFQTLLSAMGVHHMATDWLDLGCWMVVGVLVFCMLPRPARWLAPVLLMTGILVGDFANGGTDALFLPFLLVALWRWDRYPGRAVAWLPAWVAPVCLGVACSIKQTPWFCVPFLVIGVWWESGRGRHGTASALRYLGLTVATFVAINLWFIVWSPGPWLHGVLLPMIDPLVPDGQGIVALMLHGVTGGVVLPYLALGGLLVYLAVLAAVAWWEPSLRRAWPFLVPLALFLPDRSLTSYLIDLVPVAVVAAASLRPERPIPGDTRGLRWPARLSVALPAVAALGFLVVAVTAVPLSVHIDGVRTTDDAQVFRSVTVMVRNTSTVALVPHFLVDSGQVHPSGFWLSSLIAGSEPIVPGGTSTFLLRPRSFTWAPVHGQRWLVEATTTGPNALSTSPAAYWSLGSPTGQ